MRERDDGDDPVDGGDAPEPDAAPGPGDGLAARGKSRARSGRRPFDTGNAIAKTFSVWISGFVPFTAMAALVHVPMIAWTFLADEVTEPMTAVLMALLGVPLALVLSQVVTSALIYGVFQRLRGEGVSLGRCFSVGVARLLPVIAVAILSFILYALPMIPAGVAAVVASATGPSLDKLGAAGFLALLGVFPMFVIWLGLIAAVPAVVVERTGVLGALRRSWDLTRGYKWRIFLVAFVIGLVMLLVGCMFQLPTRGQPDHPLAPILDIVKDVLLAPLQAVLPAVIYHDLRVNKEGIASEELAAVFD